MTREKALRILDTIPTIGDQVDALEMAIEALERKVDTSTTNTPTETDLISRQDAVDVLNDGAELLRRALDDMDVVLDDREKFEWGLGLIEAYIDDFMNLPSAQPERKVGKTLAGEVERIKREITDIFAKQMGVQPSAQPEIIRCKDCKHYGEMLPNSDNRMICHKFALNFDNDFFCRDAERREE